jgi:hypothetical protein
MLFDRSIQLTQANRRKAINESMHARGRSGVSKVTPSGLPGKVPGEGGRGRAQKPKYAHWPIEQLANYRDQIAKLRLKTFEHDTEAKRKPEEGSRQQPERDNVTGEVRPVDPEE